MIKTFKQFLKEANENSKPIPSQNKLFGFYNELYTIFNGDEKKMKSVWNEAFNLISDISNLSSKQIRDRISKLIKSYNCNSIFTSFNSLD
mgnify:CR=1 FL=1